MPTIRQLSFYPFDIPLKKPFGIATGVQRIAKNVLVELTLSDGTVGIGEAAPFPAVNGETQAQVLSALGSLEQAILGRDAERYRSLAGLFREVLGDTPSALAAAETALLDALCRRARISLCSFFGGVEYQLITDLTIPTGDVEQAEQEAQRAEQEGFSTLKIKVGGVQHDLDVLRLRAVAKAAPTTQLLLDANGAFSADEALALLDSMGALRARVCLFEQPTRADDLDGLRQVRERGRVLVAADESARSRAEVARLASQKATDVVNIKITKTGLVEAWDMIVVARALGLDLMIGGMVETELCMTTSACLAAGLGGFRFVDLDTPLFMGPRPLRGGFTQTGPSIRLEAFLGHGVEFVVHPGNPC